MAEKKGKEKVTKVSIETQFENSNIKEYEKEDLVKMVNATSGDADFATAYPEATFTRTLAYKYLGTKYDMDFVGRSYVVPHGVTIGDLLEAYENHNSNDSASNTMQECVDGVDTVEVNMDTKKKRQTLSMNADTLQKWNEFTKDASKKSIYLTAACELFMRKAMEGKVEIKPTFVFTFERMEKVLKGEVDMKTIAFGKDAKKHDFASSSDAEEF